MIPNLASGKPFILVLFYFWCILRTSFFLAYKNVPCPFSTFPVPDLESTKCPIFAICGKWKLFSCAWLLNYTVHGILQARILEWIALPFSRGSSQPRDQTHVSRTVGGFFFFFFLFFFFFGWILYQLSHKGSPRILEWVAYPLSGRSYQPKNQTSVFCIAGGVFTNWAMR